MGRTTFSETYARIATEKAKGTCSPMPSLRQISTSRIAHEPNAPIAQTVMSCHNPPCISGAARNPYERSGGAMLICETFQVGPCDAPHRISAVPRNAKKIVVTPKKPT